MPEVALGFVVIHFEIGNGGEAARAPVHHVGAAVNESFFVEADEDFAHRATQSRVESEALAAPVAACAQAHHLALDGVTVLRLPFPDALLEFLAADLTPVDALFGEFAL